jgi:hypothetical protein
MVVGLRSSSTRLLDAGLLMDVAFRRSTNWRWNTPMANTLESRAAAGVTTGGGTSSRR